MSKTFRNNTPKEKNISNKSVSKKLNTKEKRPNNNQFKNFDYTSKDYD
jgi:hypothetical protein